MNTIVKREIADCPYGAWSFAVIAKRTGVLGCLRLIGSAFGASGLKGPMVSTTDTIVGFVDGDTRIALGL